MELIREYLRKTKATPTPKLNPLAIKAVWSEEQMQNQTIKIGIAFSDGTKMTLSVNTRFFRTTGDRSSVLYDYVAKAILKAHPNCNINLLDSFMTREIPRWI